MSDRTMPPPGPERDALLAELVFGWVYVDGGWFMDHQQDNGAIIRAWGGVGHVVR